MLDKNDITLLEKMFKNVVTGDMLARALRQNNEIFGRQLKREIRDEVQALLTMTEKRIIFEVTEFIGDSIVPQIDDHETRLIRLERKAA